MPKNLRICEFFCIFALEMRKIAFIITLCAFVLCAHAETLLLHTGARVKGEIVFRNEEVIIIRNADGARFQYPRADVKEIISDDQEGQMPNDSVIVQMADDQMVNKKASILLELAGGSAYIPSEDLGAAVSVDLLVGSHHINGRHIFIGGGLGYHGLFMVNPNAASSKNVAQKLNFLPIQAAIRIPFLEQKHSPVAGLAIGYGVALSKDYLGGLYAGVDLGYRCQLNPKTAIGAVFYTQFQQAQIITTESIEGTGFEEKTGRNLLSFGAKFTLYF